MSRPVAKPGSPKSPSTLGPHHLRITRAAQSVVVFVIDKEEWTLDLRPGQGSLSKGSPAEKADLTLTINGANFVQL